MRQMGRRIPRIAIISFFWAVFGGVQKGYTQSPFIGIFSADGSISYMAGISYLGILDVGLWYNPQNKEKTNAGFVGGTLKWPVYYNVARESYSSTLLYGFYLTGAGGSVSMPRPPGSNETKTSRKFGYNAGAGAELMLNTGTLNIAVPLEIGVGKNFFLQSFEEQDPQTSSDYRLNSNVFISMGIRISFLGNRCRDYIQNLQYGR